MTRFQANLSRKYFSARRCDNSIGIKVRAEKKTILLLCFEYENKKGEEKHFNENQKKKKLSIALLFVC